MAKKSFSCESAGVSDSVANSSKCAKNNELPMTVKTEHKDHQYKDNPILWTQVLAALGIAMTQLNTGGQFSYPGVTLPLLMDPDSEDLVLSQLEISLFTSLIDVGYVASASGSSFLMTWFGQRQMLLWSIPIGVLGWVSMGAAPTSGILITGRVIQGLSSGLISSATYNYLVELSHPSVRGRLVSMCDLFRQLGAVLAVVIGCFNLTWRQQAYIQVAFLLPPFFILMRIPDSPRWLALKGRIDESKKSLIFFRGSKFDGSKEHQQILDQISSNENLTVRSQVNLILTKQLFPIFFLTSFLMFSHHFTGNGSVLTYSVLIFQATDSTISPYLNALIMMVMRIFAAFVFILVADRIDRKTLFCGASGVCGAACCVLGIFFRMQDALDQSYANWLPLFSLVVFSFSTSLVVPALFLVRTELLPNSVRSLATGLHFSFLSFGIFVVIFAFPYMIDWIGFDWTFIFYGLCSFLTVGVAAAFIPETRGKSLEEIADHQTKKTIN